MQAFHHHRTRAVLLTAPVPGECFIVTQPYLAEDWKLYPRFGHHTGVDYGNGGMTDVPLFAIGSGEIVYRGAAETTLGAFLGNHAALYLSTVNRSFLYCHMAGQPPALGNVKAGERIGTMGATGESIGVHLHLEGYFGRFVPGLRNFSSLEDIKRKTFDADAFLRESARTPFLQKG